MIRGCAEEMGKLDSIAGKALLMSIAIYSIYLHVDLDIILATYILYIGHVYRKEACIASMSHVLEAYLYMSQIVYI